MKTFDVRQGTRHNDKSFKINFGNDGEYLRVDDEENDVVWICDDENNSEVGIYEGDLDYLIRALKLAKDLASNEEGI